VQDGIFYAEDGTLLVTADDRVEHGYTDDQNRFHAQRIVNGQTMYGFDTDDGGWISDNGKVSVDKDGSVQFGISTPDGHFLPGGTTRTLPNGDVLYGWNKGDDFLSWDGNTLVRGNGDVIHGHLDQDTGIFTPDKGAGAYVITDDGAIYGTYQDDGSILGGDGNVYMTPQAWGVDLPEFHDAIAFVRGKSGLIEDHIDAIHRKSQAIYRGWTSPAGDTFGDVSRKAATAMLVLQGLLEEMVTRMNKSYDNYLVTEQANTKNLSQ
jgi:uncharacterized protein YukE